MKLLDYFKTPSEPHWCLLQVNIIPPLRGNDLRAESSSGERARLMRAGQDRLGGVQLC